MSTFPLPQKKAFTWFFAHILTVSPFDLVALIIQICLFEGIMMMDRKIKFIALQLFRNVEWRTQKKMIRDSWYPFETVIISYPCHLHCLDMLHSFFQRLTTKHKQNSIQRFDVIVFDFMSRHFQRFFFCRIFVAFISFHLQCTFKAWSRRICSQKKNRVNFRANQLHWIRCCQNGRTNIDAMSIEIHFLKSIYVKNVRKWAKKIRRVFK